MDQLDEILNDLIDLTICANEFPRDFDYRFKMLDENYNQTIQNLSDQTLKLYSNLASYILNEDVDKSEDAFIEGDKAIQDLLNSKEMNILNEPVKSQSAQVSEIEHFVVGDCEIIYSKNIPKPPKFVNPMKYADKQNSSKNPPLHELTELPLIVNPLTPDFDMSKVVIVNDISKEKKCCEEISYSFPRGPLFIACLNHRVRTYRPFCCILLVMTPQYKVYFFDILQIRSDTRALYNLMMEKSITKIMYDTEPDLHILAESHNLYISPLLDVSVQKTPLEVYLAVNLKKNLRKCVVDWRIRPIANELIEIAVQSIWYLPNIAYEVMNITDKNLLLKQKWEFPLLPYSFTEFQANEATQVIASLDSEITNLELKIIFELVKWRDSIAVIEEESPNFVASDIALLKIAKTKPKTINDLSSCLNDIFTPYIESFAPDIVTIVSKSNPSDANNIFNLIH